MATKRKAKKLRPSYEQGKFHDPKIEQLQDPKFDKGELDALVHKAGKHRTGRS